MWESHKRVARKSARTCLCPYHLASFLMPNSLWKILQISLCFWLPLFTGHSLVKFVYLFFFVFDLFSTQIFICQIKSLASMVYIWYIYSPYGGYHSIYSIFPLTSNCLCSSGRHLSRSIRMYIAYRYTHTYVCIVIRLSTHKEINYLLQFVCSSTFWHRYWKLWQKRDSQSSQSSLLLLTLGSRFIYRNISQQKYQLSGSVLCSLNT